MSNNKYLAIGAKVADEYSIIDVLGEDEFEILYLVRDNRGGFFVLKELYLETFSTRFDDVIVNIPEAEGVFDKRRTQIIKEVNESKVRNTINQVKIYGYVEDNDTIYTIMEYTNNAGLENYLQFHPKDKKSLPTLEELINSKQKFNLISFLWKVLTVLLLSVLAWFAYKVLIENRTVNETQEEEFVKKEFIKKESIEKKPLLRDRIPIQIEEKNKVEEIERKVEDKNDSTLDLVIKPIVEQKQEVISEINETNISDEINLTIEDNSTTVIVEQKEIFTKESVDLFLNKYILAEANGSIEDILESYDDNLDRYFKLKNINITKIKNEKIKYNEKWTKRAFEILDFEILKRYQIDDIDYCDVLTRTKWSVSKSNGQVYSGMSKGHMGLKNSENGFKVNSIYTVK